jgi:hypothetical protein
MAFVLFIEQVLMMRHMSASSAYVHLITTLVGTFAVTMIQQLALHVSIALSGVNDAACPRARSDVN